MRIGVIMKNIILLFFLISTSALAEKRQYYHEANNWWLVTGATSSKERKGDNLTGIKVIKYGDNVLCDLDDGLEYSTSNEKVHYRDLTCKINGEVVHIISSCENKKSIILKSYNKKEIEV